MASRFKIRKVVIVLILPVLGIPSVSCPFIKFTPQIEYIIVKVVLNIEEFIIFLSATSQIGKSGIAIINL
ncbi:MAG: hypothetical protein NG784_04940 [Candidatus Jettenia sp.]|nr:hypothetical protein [Candidatus Jettenia sp.]